MEEEAKVEKEGEICIMSGRNKGICTCFNCFRSWCLSQSKNLPSSQPCIKRTDDVSCKPRFNSQTLPVCKRSDSNGDEPSQKKSKLSDSEGKDQKKLSPTKFKVEKFNSGEVIIKSTTQDVSDLSKNKDQTTCLDSVIEISEESSASIFSDSDDTLPNLTPPMSDNTDDEEKDKEEIILVDCDPGRTGENENSEIIDSTENNGESEVLFNYSQEDAVILISDDDDDDEVGDAEYDNNEEDEEVEDVDRRTEGMDVESSEKPCHRNDISFVNASVQFPKEVSKNFCEEIKKEIPDSLAGYGIDVSAKHKIKKEKEKPEEHFNPSDIPSVKLELRSSEEKTGKAIQNPENTQLCHLSHVKQEKPDSQDFVLFEEWKESRKPNSDVAEDKPSNVCFKQDDSSGGKHVQSPIIPSKCKLSPDRFSSSARNDDDADTQCYPLKPNVLPKVTRTVNQWLTRQEDHGKAFIKPFVSNDVDFDDSDDDDDDDELYMCATQVEENLFKEEQLNKKVKKESPQMSRCYKLSQKTPKPSTTPESPKYSSKKVEDLRDSSTKTASDFLTPHIAKKTSPSIVTQKTKGKLPKPCWKNTDEDFDSSGSVYSMATQVDHNVSLVNDNDADDDDDDDDDDRLYMQNTQVESIPSFKLKPKFMYSLAKNKKLLDTIDDDSDSDDSLFSIATQVDSNTSVSSQVNSNNLKLKSRFMYLSTKNKKLLDTNDDDSDSDDSLFSVATQVDSNTVPKTGHQVKKNCSLFPKLPTSVTNSSRQVPRTKESEFKTPKFPHQRKKSKCISSDTADKTVPSGAFLNKTMTLKSVQHSTTTYKDVDEDSDSDSSVFSIATQLDDPLPCKKDERKDEDPYFQATQVDKPQSNFNTRTKLLSPKANIFKIPLQPTKKLSKPSTLKLDLPHCKERNEDYDSDDSLFSVATQVDDLCPLNINNKGQEELYMKETQVDEPFPSKSSKSQHGFHSPVHSKAKASRKNSTSKPKASIDDDEDKDDLFLAATQVDSVNSSTAVAQTTDSSYSDFVLALAETEPSGTATLQQVECEENEQHQPDPKFADFLLNLCEDTDQNESKPLTVVKASEIEPQRLKSRKEMREDFKLQRMKMDNKIKLKSSEKSPTKLFPTTNLSVEESVLPKKRKKSSLKNLKVSTEKVISEGISSAKNQLEGRFLFMSLDKTPAKWTKSTSVAIGSSALLSSDVTLPNADQIKKLGLPLIQTPKRRRPLPETAIKNHPEESQDIKRACSPILDTAIAGSSTQNRLPPTLPTPPTPPTQPTPPTPLNPIFANNQKTNYSYNSKISQSKHGPLSSTSLPKKLPLFENSDKCFSKDFSSFHIPKIKTFPQKPKPDLTQGTTITTTTTTTTTTATTTLFPHKCNNSVLNQTSPSEVPKCGPSYSKSFLGHIKPSTSNANTSKRVTFSNVNKVDVISQSHWSQSNAHRAHRDLLQYLLKWNTKWLQEHNTLRTVPPIVNKDQLFPLLQSYPSYAEYVSVILPLLLLEVWECAYREYMETLSTARILKVVCCNVCKASCSHFDYIIYGVVSEMDQFANNCISEGDFIILKLRVKSSTSQSSSSGVNYGDSSTDSEYPVFGYVESVIFQKPQYYDGIFDRFPDLASLSKTIPNFRVFRAIIKCHRRNLTHCFSKLLEVQFLSSLIPFLRQYKALMKFVSNPLHSHILNPADGTALVTDSAIPVHGNYNVSQKKAISAAAEMACLPISKPYYCLVQGPPGTGKSHTIIGMIQKIKEQKPQSKILLCAPSNGAVDELMRRLIETKQKDQAKSHGSLKFVRIGNPKYIHKDVVEYSLKKLILHNFKPNGVKHDGMLAQKKLYCDELKRNEEEIFKISKLPKSSLRDEKIRKLRKDSRYIKDKVDLLKKQLENNQAAMNNIEPSPAAEASIERSLLSKADVICGTLSTCGSNRFVSKLADEQFTCIIIDEASQCCELDSLIPLQYNCCKLILIGDTEQLSPTIISQIALEYNYGQSLFERLCKHFKYRDKNSVILLNTQYRMHPDICKFPNRYIYDNQLISDSALEARSSNIPVVPYLLFDVQFGSHVRSADSGSLSNPLEADFTVCLCERLSNVKVGRTLLKIAVIAPYKQQKKLLECRLAERKLSNVDVTTVDGFQGRENDIIVMSCVRANSLFGNIGFLKNRRRLNVALTRAKFALYIVGHLASLEGDEDWKSLIQDAHDRHLVLRVGHPDQFQSIVKKCIKV